MNQNKTSFEKKSNLLDFFHAPEPRSKKNQEKEGVKQPQKISLSDQVVFTTHTLEISFEDFLRSRPDG